MRPMIVIQLTLFDEPELSPEEQLANVAMVREQLRHLPKAPKPLPRVYAVA